MPKLHSEINGLKKIRIFKFARCFVTHTHQAEMNNLEIVVRCTVPTAVLVAPTFMLYSIDYCTRVLHFGAEARPFRDTPIYSCILKAVALV
jgi:hypothetical protein